MLGPSSKGVGNPVPIPIHPHYRGIRVAIKEVDTSSHNISPLLANQLLPLNSTNDYLVVELKDYV
jgi:hypothetical protein